MKTAREEFGPPRKAENMAKLLQNSSIRDQIQTIGNDLKQAGVKQDGQGHLNLVKNDHSDPAVKKDLAVAQGDRPALTPCDGKVQQAGNALKDAGATKSASAEFKAPGPTPNMPPPPKADRDKRARVSVLPTSFESSSR